MKKLLDVAHGNLIDVIGWHGILDQYLWMSVMPQDDHLCSKSAQKLVSLEYRISTNSFRVFFLNWEIVKIQICSCLKFQFVT